MNNLLRRISTNIKLSRNLGAGLKNTVHFFFVSFWIPVRKRFGMGNTPIKVVLKKFDKVFSCYITDGSDMAVLREIFLDDEYTIDLVDEPREIIDLGANVGYASLYLHLKFPSAHIYSVEPDPRNIEKLERNVKDITNITVLPYAIAAEDGEINIYLSRLGMSSSIIERDEGSQAVKVRARGLDNLMRDYSLKAVDLIKFDIEGAEYSVFKEFEQCDNVGAFIGEVHLDLIEVDLSSFIALFKKCKIQLQEHSTTRYVMTAIC